jgi:hypothetical protein
VKEEHAPVKARQVLSGTPGPPYQRSVHITNAILRDALVDLGYEASCVWKPYNRTTDITNWVPLAAMELVDGFFQQGILALSPAGGPASERAID